MTKSVYVTSSWTKVATGACFAQNRTMDNMFVVFDTTAPDENTENFHVWHYGDFEYGGSEDVYMRTRRDITTPAKIVVTEL